MNTWLDIAYPISLLAFAVIGFLWIYKIFTNFSNHKSIILFDIFVALCCFGICTLDVIRLF